MTTTEKKPRKVAEPRQSLKGLTDEEKRARRNQHAANWRNRNKDNPEWIKQRKEYADRKYAEMMADPVRRKERAAVQKEYRHQNHEKDREYMRAYMREYRKKQAEKRKAQHQIEADEKKLAAMEQLNLNEAEYERARQLFTQKNTKPTSGEKGE